MLLIVYDIPLMYNFVLCATLVHYSNTMSLMLTQVFKHHLLIPRSKCLNYSVFGQVSVGCLSQSQAYLSTWILLSSNRSIYKIQIRERLVRLLSYLNFGWNLLVYYQLNNNSSSKFYNRCAYSYFKNVKVHSVVWTEYEVFNVSQKRSENYVEKT